MREKHGCAIHMIMNTGESMKAEMIEGLSEGGSRMDEYVRNGYVGM